MSTRRPAFRLARLRRSAGLAAFALVLFLFRIGMVVACAPSDFAELSHAAASVSVVHDAASIDDAQHGDGHCLHCSCHQAVALPGGIAGLPAAPAAFVTPVLPLREIIAPPDFELRPPIR